MTSLSSPGLVSIVVPFHNRQKELCQTISSVLRQSYENFELLLVNDASTDRSVDLVKSISEADNRVRLLTLESRQRGAPAARNTGLANSTGEFVLFLDSDDMLGLTCLTRRVQKLSSDTTIDAAIGQGLLFSVIPGDSRTLWNQIAHGSEDFIALFFAQDMPWQTAGPLWRRNALTRIGAWDHELISFQDWEFHVRGCLLGISVAFLDSPDFYIRRNSSEPRISHYHFDSAHIASRNLALAKAWQYAKRIAHSGDLRKHIKAFLVRNEIELVDCDVTSDQGVFEKSEAGAEVLCVLDRATLRKVRRAGAGWRSNRIVSRLVHYVWRGASFDPQASRTFLNTEYLGTPPRSVVELPSNWRPVVDF